MGDPRLSGAGGGGRRRWSFADCCFDESNWTLTVADKRVAIESKPLQILRQLLLQPGQVVSKAELLDAIWPNIAVVEASLPTAVHKLRVALGDELREAPIVETVPRIGYRLAVPVTVSKGMANEGERVPSPRLAPRNWPSGARLAAVTVTAVLIGSITLAVTGMQDQPAPSPPPTVANVDRALRRLDVEQIETFIAAGWDVNMAMDADRNTALNRLLDMCEWDPAHDRRRMLLMARTLVDAGTRIGDHNTFGDTPYSIAKAPRFCGDRHPVTVMLRNLCFNGGAANTLRDRCLATYELKRRASGA